MGKKGGGRKNFAVRAVCAPLDTCFKGGGCGSSRGDEKNGGLPLAFALRGFAGKTRQKQKPNRENKAKAETKIERQASACFVIRDKQRIIGRREALLSERRVHFAQKSISDFVTPIRIWSKKTGKSENV